MLLSPQAMSNSEKGSSKKPNKTSDKKNSQAKKLRQNICTPKASLTNNTLDVCFLKCDVIKDVSEIGFKEI